MSRPTVIAGQFQDATLATALRQHREDRAALLHSLTASLQSDPSVRAAWLWGSFGREEADDLSDLDLWIVVADEVAPKFGPVLRLYAEQAGHFIFGGENPKNGPVGGGYFGSLHEGRHGLLHLDGYWQPQSAVVSVPERALLFDRLDEPYGPAGLPPVSAPTPSGDDTSIKSQIEGSLSFVWLMFSNAAKYLARDSASNMELMFYPKSGLEEAIKILGQEAVLLPLDWSVPEEPLEKVARLRYLVEKAGQVTAFANTQGLLVSSHYAPCLFRYLDMVQGIVVR